MLVEYAVYCINWMLMSVDPATQMTVWFFWCVRESREVLYARIGSRVVQLTLLETVSLATIAVLVTSVERL